MITVCCVLVRGHVKFTPEYVVKLRSMAKRFLPEHRFVCLTDFPIRFDQGIETVRTTPVGDVFAWWKKLELFKLRELSEGRIVYFDLDVILMRDCSPIVEFPAPFALVPDAGNFPGRGERRVVKRFNSSVMVWDGGTLGHLHGDWHPKVAKRLWGDQDWIGERQPDAAKMPLSWFPRLSEIRTVGDTPLLHHDARVVLCKKPKNVDAAAKYPWVEAMWR